MNKKTYKTPLFATWIFNRVASIDERYSLAGDLLEEYNIIHEKHGRIRAHLWFWKHLIRMTPPIFKYSVKGSAAMFKNYLKISLRTIKRHKSYSFINIAGLSVGMTCCILIFLWVHYEFSFDRFHENFDNIYRVISETETSQQTSLIPRTPNPLGPYLKENFPEVVNFIRYQSFDGWLVKCNDKKFTNDIIGVADPQILEMFTFTFIKGDPKTALQDRYSLIISESMAKKYFGDEDPIGKVVNILEDFYISGVFKDIPQNSHIYFDCMFPVVNMEEFWHDNFQNWRRIMYYTYIQLKEGISFKDLDPKIANVVIEHFPQSNSKIFLQPLSKVHLYSDYVWDLDNYNKGNVNIISYISLTALLILVIACINFINLSTARSSIRAREVGMRKITGAYRRDIIKQFLGESLLLSVIALFIALFLTVLILPVFNQLAGRNLTISVFSNFEVISGLIIITLFTGMLSGGYPAIHLSSFKPVKVLKYIGGISSQKGIFLRSLLVILQFTFTIILIVGTTVVYNQLEFIRNKDLGFEKKNIITLQNLVQFSRNPETVKNELYENPNILNLSCSQPPGTELRGVAGIRWEGKSTDEEIILYPLMVDYRFLETFNIDLVEGRFFSKNPDENTGRLDVNEAAVSAMGMKNPIGKRLSYTTQDGPREGRIMGIIKNYHQSSLRNEIEPLVLLTGEELWNLCIKILPGKETEVLSFLEQKWKELEPDRPFEYEFIDKKIENLYAIEEKIGVISGYFTLIAITIACMGLFGLASFVSARRTKEIGIRKVLGASAPRVIFMLSKEFLRLIIISTFIAFPVSYFVTNKLLEFYAYKAEIGAGIFIFTFFLSIVITFVTVAYQTYKAAAANPVDSLKYE